MTDPEKSPDSTMVIINESGYKITIENSLGDKIELDNGEELLANIYNRDDGTSPYLNITSITKDPE
jgi:hypothetical protein